MTTEVLTGAMALVLEEGATSQGYRWTLKAQKNTDFTEALCGKTFFKS